MIALLWEDVAVDIAAAKRHFGQAITLYRTAMTDSADYVTSMAFQHAMMAGYTAFEVGLKRLLHIMDEPVPVGPDGHATLVARLARPIEGGRPPLFDAPLLRHVDELRRFRHIAMHAYDDFSPRRAAVPVEAAEAFLASIDAALARFQAAIDP